jgi:hypothetical protein
MGDWSQPQDFTDTDTKRPMEIDILHPDGTNQYISPETEERVRFSSYLNEEYANPTYNEIGGADFINNKWTCPDDGLYLVWIRMDIYDGETDTLAFVDVWAEAANSWDPDTNILGDETIYRWDSNEVSQFQFIQIPQLLSNDDIYITVYNGSTTNDLSIMGDTSTRMGFLKLRT